MWDTPVGDSVKCPAAQPPWVLGGHPWAHCRGCAHNRELLTHPGGHWDPHPPWGAEPDKALQGDGAVSSQVG